jgi:hypothetical protein
MSSFHWSLCIYTPIVILHNQGFSFGGGGGDGEGVGIYLLSMCSHEVLNMFQ